MRHHLDTVVKRSIEFNKQIKQRRPSLKQPLPKKLLSKSCMCRIFIFRNFIDYHFSTYQRYFTSSSFIPSSFEYVTWSIGDISLWYFINCFTRKTSCTSDIHSSD